MHCSRVAGTHIDAHAPGIICVVKAQRGEPLGHEKIHEFATSLSVDIWIVTILWDTCRREFAASSVVGRRVRFRRQSGHNNMRVPRGTLAGWQGRRMGTNEPPSLLLRLLPEARDVVAARGGLDRNDHS